MNQIPLAIADLELQLASAIGPGDESFTLSSDKDDDGNAIPAGIYVFTVDNGTSQKEYLLGQVNGVNVTSVKSVSRQGVESTGAARRHRIGAPCIVTNFATIQRAADILRGTLNLDGASPIAYDSEPTLADREQLATVGYVLDAAFGGSVAFDNQTITGVNAGETVAAGDLLYFKTSDQEWYKTDASDATTVQNVQLGIALGAGSDGVAITGGVRVAGVFTTTGLTAGATYYASDTAGEISTTVSGPAIGFALSTTRLFLFNTNPVSENATPSGSVSVFAGTSVPSGWLLCDGQAVSRPLFSRLFSAIGTSYGAGDGSTTFNVPDLRAKIPVGLQSSDEDFDDLGKTGGEKEHTLTEAEMPKHRHGNLLRSFSGGSENSTMTVWNSISGFGNASASYPDEMDGRQGMSDKGDDQPHNNMPPYVVMNYIIKT